MSTTSNMLSNLKRELQGNIIPKHVAIIMDGNGRWARSKGIINRVFGHKNAIKAVREAAEGAAELGIQFLTLYAFSTENWERPRAEVEALMTLLVHTIKEEIPTLMKNNIRLQSVGDKTMLPENCQQELEEGIEATRVNTGLQLVLALSYSGKWDIAHAAKQIADAAVKGHIHVADINEELFSRYLGSSMLPDVDLMIRTGGDYRISNFMLWQLAYAELHIEDELFWPDFRKEHLYKAIQSFQTKQRRFGKTGDQIETTTT
jgi:undecaprenyl diphosphate synthase